MLNKLVARYRSSSSTQLRPQPSPNLPVTVQQAPLERPGADGSTLSNDGIKVWRDVLGPIVDIVFVHGLGGKRDGTWTAKNTSNPWPVELLSDTVPRARLLTFGYHASLKGKSTSLSINGLRDHARNLMRDVVNNRNGCSATGRPLIFVAHSMGGLISKMAVLMSRNEEEIDYHDVFDSLVGIIFMGTPHRGSWMADWAAIPASALDLVVPTNTKKLREILTTDNQLLEAIQEDFLSMLREQLGERRKIEIMCFFEELPIYKGLRVVERHSATLEGYNDASIYANHSNMVKFASKNDGGFQRVSGELRRWHSRVRKYE